MNEFLDWVVTNKAKFWISVVMGMALFGMLWGSIAGIGALVGDETVTVKIDNDCLTKDGLVRGNASARCYEDKQARTVIAASTITTADTVTNKKPPTPPEPLVYDPPCGPGSNTHVCTEQVTEKSRVSGRIHTVTFHGDATEGDASDDHVIPDYTEVEYDPCDGDDCEYAQVKFCGNQLDSFEPGKMLSMVVKDSNLTEYNGCYMLAVTELTNGGKPISRWQPKRKSMVPGSN